MFIQAIEYQLKEKGEWFKGWYVGNEFNGKHSTFLDKNYQPLNKNGEVPTIWDWKEDTDKTLQLYIED